MIVLHAGFLDGGVVVWGETPLGELRGRLPGARLPAAVRGRPVERHPFDAGPDAVAVALGAADVVPAQPRRQAWAWLPSRADDPVVTSRLLTGEPASSPARGRPSLRPWRVTAQPLAGPELVELLARCAGAHTLDRGVVLGPELGWWVAALQHASALVARQQFLPSLSADGTVAAWTPVIMGAEEQRVDALAAAMPHVVRALGAPQVRRPDDPPRELLEGFLGRAVDTVVRAALSDAAPRAGAVHSAHDAWSVALSSIDAALDAPRDDADGLVEEVAEWQRPIGAASTAAFRLVFRITEPEGDVGDGAPAAAPAAQPWILSTHLQARSDPSLVVAVEGLLSAAAASADLALLEGHGFDVFEHLLGPLGQAAGMCGLLTAGGAEGLGCAVELDDARAFEFLTHHSVALERAGFGVLLPAWFTRGGAARLSLRAKAKSRKESAPSGGLSLDRVAQVEWSVALGEATLTRAELHALARAKVPLVRLRGRWVQVDAQELREALDRWGRKATDEMSVRELVRMALTGESPFSRSGGGRASSFEIAGVEATGWIGDLLDRLDGSAGFTELAPPTTLEATLRPYQVRGLSWLAFLRELGFGACLADDMGLGKTIQTLASIARDHEEHAAAASETGARTRTPGPVLLVCPTSVVGNWQREAERFTPGLAVMVHHGGERLDGGAFTRAAKRHALVVTTYALLHRDFERLAKVRWHGVVLDEAQNIKNPETKQARAARELRSGWRVALTGTPVENHVGDLWSVMEFLNPGLLGPRTRFRREYLLPIQEQRDEAAAERLRRMTGPFVLRRLKTDRSIIRDLPRKNELKVGCSLTSEQASLYQAVLDDIQQQIEGAGEGIERKGLVLALMTKLKQVCNHPSQLLADGGRIEGRSGKLERLTEMLGEVLAAGERALVFTQYTQMGAMMRNHLEATFGQEVGYLHGGTTKRARDTMVERFQDGTGPNIFLLSLKAGGTGLNLTAANHVFHYDRWWNPAVEDQATDRAFRIGQRRPVSVHKFVCLGTFEQRIDELIERKQSVAGAVVGAGEQWLTELSDSQLRDMFALREDRVTV